MAMPGDGFNRYGNVGLVLGRKEGERIRVGEGDDAVWVTLVRARHGEARIGIDAPEDVEILREELVR
jgi:carbon storage regulator CsrA